MIASRARLIICFNAASNFTKPSPAAWHQVGLEPKWARPFSSSAEETPKCEAPERPGIVVEYSRGLPNLIIPLPSRKERCVFTLKPITNSVGDLMEQIQIEDRGVDHVAVKTTDGTRIASSNSIESLMENDFDLIINDVTYRVKTPARERITREELEHLSDVKNLVSQLYEALHVDEHQTKKERHLLSRLEDLQCKLIPLEQQKNAIAAKAQRRTTVLTWTGLVLMGVQFGALARLTWWEYSWDIMEPVTYFVTYGTSMACFAYYVLTKQEYILPDVRDREYLLHFHKKAKEQGLDVDEYNRLREAIAQVEEDLQRLRDPLRIQLPHRYGKQLMDHEEANQRLAVTASLWDRANIHLQKLFRSARP